MKILIGALALAAVLGAPAALADTKKPTIVLVHGAFADASGWNDVIARLNRDGYTTIAAANPLRSLAGDAAELSALVKSIKGDVVLVGHSYAGLVVNEAADGNTNVKALVFVAAFIPDIGESAATLSAKFPGSTLGDTLNSVELPGGGKDLYIQPAKFPEQFAADVPLETAALMAQTQRPITEAALGGASTVAAWKTIPSFSIYGSGDLNIPAAAQGFMAERARLVKAIEIDNASHVLMISHPREVTELIEEAATAR